MTTDFALYLSKQLLWKALTVSFPVIFAAVLCGLIVSILQAVTQIQDSTLNTIPKILVVLMMLMVCGGWMLHSMVDFSRGIILGIPEALG